MAFVKVLIEGCLASDSESGKTRPTVSLIRDRDVAMVVDPGMVEDKQALIDALKKEGLLVEDINFVCITHSHIDHYLNVGMFQNAKILEFFGLWNKEGEMGDWQERFSDDIQVMKTPGHDNTSISLFAKTDEGIVAVCGDVFWKENYPKEPELDIYAIDTKKLERSRKLVMEMSHWIIPGHGKIFKTANGKKLFKAKNGKENGTESQVKGRCKKCKKPFRKISDKCFCQEWLCYRCCECELDCNSCNCKHRIKRP